VVVNIGRVRMVLRKANGTVGVKSEARHLLDGVWGCGGFRVVENTAPIRMVLWTASGTVKGFEGEARQFWTEFGVVECSGWYRISSRFEWCYGELLGR